MSELAKENMRERLGNIDRIRDLLFGEEIDQYNRQFEDLEQKLTDCSEKIDKIASELGNFKQENNERLIALQDNLSSQIAALTDSFEKKIKYFVLNQQEDRNNLQNQIDVGEQKYTENLESLQNLTTERFNGLKEEFERSHNKLEDEVQAIKKQFFEKIERNFIDLKESKISKKDLAEVLFDLCLKIKGSEPFPTNGESSIKAELLLPEQQH
jgi:hypothetical protein